MNKYLPKNICPECKEVIWDKNEKTNKVKCKNKKCGIRFEKKLHNLIGANIYKENKNTYVLEFPEYEEKNIYPTFELLHNELLVMMENSKNQLIYDEIEIKGVHKRKKLHLYFCGMNYDKVSVDFEPNQDEFTVILPSLVARKGKLIINGDEYEYK